MSGVRILVVDDLAPNRHLLEVKLAAEYYDVTMADSTKSALKVLENTKIDLILMDAVMPGLDGFEACRRIKANPATAHIPVIMVTALEEKKDRIRGLKAGADDFITKPIDDFNLLARVRSLLRLKMVTDQLMGHIGMSYDDTHSIFQQIDNRTSEIVVVEDNDWRATKLTESLEGHHNSRVLTDPKAIMACRPGDTDLIIISLTAESFDALRLCASLKVDPNTRMIPILGIGIPDQEDKLVRAYDLGVNDTILRPIETEELIARVNTQVRRKFYADALQDNFNESLDMVVADPLTGLGNRRYFEQAVAPLFASLNDAGEPFSIAVVDIDHFKRVNDILGHDVGDDVLREIATRLGTNLRAIDVVSRYGGEEFMIAMPGQTQEDATKAVTRMHSLISGTPIHVDGQAFVITVSAGVAEVNPGEKLRDVFKRADSALYKAKSGGRNQVVTAGVKNQAA